MNVIEDHISLARSANFTLQVFHTPQGVFPFFRRRREAVQATTLPSALLRFGCHRSRNMAHLTSLLLAPRAFESVPHCTGRARNAPTDVGDGDLGVPMESKILREENRHERDRRSHFTCAERIFHAAAISHARRRISLFRRRYRRQKKRRSFERLFGSRQLPIFPGRLQPSIVGVCALNFCVRDGNRWDRTA